jgi:glycerol-3-phosphate cytidylyltransferase
MSKKTTVITFGTFDLFHYGHLEILKRARELGDRLIVGISTDELNFTKKNKYPIYSFYEREKIIQSIKYVDITFAEESLEQKMEYIEKYNADILVMGDDWEGKFDGLLPQSKVIYLPRTPSISTSETIEIIRRIK